jgi:hypothetical protein
MQHRIFLEKLALARNDQNVKVAVFVDELADYVLVDVTDVKFNGDCIIIETPTLYGNEPIHR